MKKFTDACKTKKTRSVWALQAEAVLYFIHRFVKTFQCYSLDCLSYKHLSLVCKQFVWLQYYRLDWREIKERIIFLAVLELKENIQVPLLCCDDSLPSSCSDSSVICLPSVLSSQSGEVISEKHAGYNDPIFYIYTSGTTGASEDPKTFIKNMFQVFPRQQWSSTLATCLPATVSTAWV